MLRSSWILVLLSALGFGCIIVTDDGSTDDADTGANDDEAHGPMHDGADDTGPSQGCEVGSEGCPCTTGGKCNDPFSCNNNLNICVADVCPVGTEACACTPEGACDPGLTCASAICVDLGCPVGTEACPCTGGGGCDPGLVCLSDFCVDANAGDSGG